MPPAAFVREPPGPQGPKAACVHRSYTTVSICTALVKNIHTFIPYHQTKRVVDINKRAEGQQAVVPSRIMPHEGMEGCRPHHYVGPAIVRSCFSRTSIKDRSPANTKTFSETQVDPVIVIPRQIGKTISRQKCAHVEGARQPVDQSDVIRRLDYQKVTYTCFHLPRRLWFETNHKSSIP